MGARKLLMASEDPTSSANAMLIRTKMKEYLKEGKEAVRKLSALINKNEQSSVIVLHPVQTGNMYDSGGEGSEDESSETADSAPMYSSNTIDAEMKEWEKMKPEDWTKLCYLTWNMNDPDPTSLSVPKYTLPELTSMFWNVKQNEWPLLAQVAKFVTSSLSSAAPIEKFFSETSRTTVFSRSRILCETVQTTHQCKKTSEVFVQSIKAYEHEMTSKADEMRE